MINYVKTSHKFFGKYAKEMEKYFSDIRNDLRKANLKFTVEEYLSTSLMTITLAFVVEVIFLSFVLGIFFNPIISVIVAFALSVAISGVIFFVFYSYPTAVAANRAKKINMALPFAVSYLTSISSGKMPPATMFKTLANFEEYGEVAKEAGTISKNIELFGMTVSAALRRQADRTPSNEFKEVLYGINTTLTAGSNLTLYLREKTNELMNNYRRTITKYSHDLSLFVEIYLTLIITGSIFFIVLSSIMSVISGGLGTAMIQTFVVFILLPLISIGFIVLIKTVSPVE